MSGQGEQVGRRAAPVFGNVWAQSVEQVIAELDGDAEEGLTKAEAERRLREWGANDLGKETGPQYWKAFLRQIANAMTLVCLPPGPASAFSTEIQILITTKIGSPRDWHSFSGDQGMDRSRRHPNRHPRQRVYRCQGGDQGDQDHARSAEYE